MEQQIIGKIVAATGEVFQQTNGETIQLIVGSPVYKGAVLVTGKGAHAEVLFVDDSMLSQSENTNISLDEYIFAQPDTPNAVLLNLVQGTMRVITGKIAEENPENFEVKSPLAILGIRGTDFTFSHTSSEGSRVILNQISQNHILIVRDQDGTIRYLNIPGSYVTIEEGLPISPIQFYTPEQMLQLLQLTPFTTLPNNGITSDDNTLPGTGEVKQGTEILAEDIESDQQYVPGETDLLSEDVAAIQQALAAGDFSILETMDPTAAGFKYSGNLPGELFVYNLDGSFDNGTPGTNPFSQSQPGSHLYEPAGVNLPGTIFSAGQTPDLYSPVQGNYPGRTPLPQTSEEQPFQATPLDVQPFLTPTDGPPFLTPPVDGQSPPGTNTPTSSVIPPPSLPPGLLLHGTSGDDILIGGEGNDILMGYGGVDQMYGNGGNDQFVIWGTFESAVYSGQDIAGNDLTVGSTFSHLPDLIIDGGIGYDTLISYGTADFSGVTLNSIEAIEIHSHVTFTPEQLAGITSLTGVGTENHSITLTSNGQGPVTVDLTNMDLNNIDQMIIETDVTVIMKSTDLAKMDLSGEDSAIVGKGTLIPKGGNFKKFIDDYDENIDNDITLGKMPDQIDIDNNEVPENSGIGTVVGMLSTIDEDEGDVQVFTIVNNPDFAINNHNEIVTTATFVEPGSYDLEITVTDYSGQTKSDTITIEVIDVNYAPTTITLDNQQVTENNVGAVIGMLTTTDPDAGDTHTYTVSDTRFEVVDNQLKLTDTESLDFETEPEVNIEATTTDSGNPNLTTSQTFTLTVNNIYDQVFRDLGQEFQVNTHTDDYQQDSAVTSLTNGGFVVIWTSEDQDGDYRGIYGQAYDADGTPHPTSEFQVNTYTTEEQVEPSVTSLTDGGFVVTWTSYGQDGSGDGIYGQVYDADGNPDYAIEFQVNTHVPWSQESSAVTGLTNGGFVVTWQSYGQDGAGEGIYGQIFDTNGNQVGGEFQVNNYIDDDQSEPAVTNLTNGGFVVTWTSNIQDGDARGVYGKVFDASGSPDPAGEFQVNFSTTNGQYLPSVTGLTAGGFVVTWQSNMQDGSFLGIYGQVFDANGNQVGGEFQVNTYTNNNQSHSAVTSLADGGFVVTWDSQENEFSTGVYGQFFDASGIPDPAGEFQINTYTDNHQEFPSVTGLADGGFVVTWTSYSLDGSGYDIHSQIFTAGDTITASGAGTFSGTSGNDIIKGDAQVQTLYGKDGNDILKGGAGADTLHGEAGDDTFVAWGAFNPNTYMDDPGTLNVNESLDEAGDSLLGGNPDPADNHLVAGEIIDGGDGVDTLVTYGDVDLTTTDVQNMEVLEIKDNSTVTVNESQLSGLTVSGQGNLKPLTSLSMSDFMTSYGANIGQSITVGNAATAILLLDSQQTLISSIDENSTGLIGYLSAQDQNSGDSHTFTLGNGTSQGFRIENNNELWLDLPLDYNTANSVSIDIQATDLGNAAYDGSLTFAVNNVDEQTFRQLGQEFLVNTCINGSQLVSTITSLADGGFVVTWISDGQDGDSYGIYGQLFEASGSTAGSEFLVNTYTTDDQEYPAVTGLTDGGFVVTWTSYGQDTSLGGVFGQVFDADGDKEGNEFQVNTYTTYWQWDPSVTNLADGGFVVTWTSDEHDGSSYGISGQVYDAGGDKEGNEFQVNATTSAEQEEPSVTGLADGGFMVTWSSDGQDGSNYGIYGQVFDADGDKDGNEFQVNTHTNDWQGRPSVTNLGDGGFVVTWTSYDQDGSALGIYGQVFDANGDNDGNEFQVNTHTNDWQFDPSVTSLEDGGFIVTWTSDGQDGSGYGIYGQVFDAEGDKDGNEFQVNTYTADSQSYPAITGLKDGGFLVTWTSDGQDGSGYGIYGQRFILDPPGNDAPVIVSLSSTTVDENQSAGTVVGTLSAIDPDAGDTHTYEIVGGNSVDFTIVGNELQLVNGLDFEEAASHDVIIQATDQDGLNLEQQFTIQVNNINEAPTDILVHDGQQNSILSIEENSTGMIGYLSAMDQDSGDSHTFAITEGAYQGFRIENGNELWLDSSMNYESGPSCQLVIQATDLGQNVYEESIVFGITDVADEHPEFRVNTHTTYNQSFPAVTTLADGRYVVTWESNQQDGDDVNGIFGQILDAEGNPEGGEFHVNTYTDRDQRFSAVTSLTDGGFVVTWQSWSQDGDSFGVYGQLFDSGGDRVSNEFMVNTHTYTSQMEPAVTGLSDGGFIITWQSDKQDGYFYPGIYGQIYDANGSTVGNEFQIKNTANGQQYPSITTLNNGGFVITWQSYGDGSKEGIYGQLYDGSGTTVGNEFQINTETLDDQLHPAVTSLADGGFVVTWHSAGQDGEHYGVYGQVFEANGDPAGNEFQVNTFYLRAQMDSAVTGLPDGGFVVTWESHQDGNYAGVYGQVFDAHGNPEGDEFQINTFYLGNQCWSAVTSLPDGGFAVTWTSAYQDGSGNGIYSKIYSGEEIAAWGSGTFYGTPVNDIIWGDDQDQTIYGRSGNDIIKGGAGADTMYGESGDDTFVIWGTFAAGYYVDDPQTPDVDEGRDATGDYLAAGNPDSLLNHLQPGEIIDGGDGVDTLATYGDVDLTMADMQNMEILEIKENSTVTVNENQMTGLTVTGQGKLNPQTSLSLPDFMASYGTNIGQNVTVGNAATAILILDSQQNSILSIDENSAGLIGYLSALDQDSGDSHTFTITDGLYQGFRIENGNELWLDSPKNYESDPSCQLVIQATDVGQGVYAESIAFDITDVVEQPFREVGPEFQVNTYIDNHQNHPAVTGLADGGYVITWMSNGQDGSNWGVYGQVFDADGTPDLAGEFQVNTYTLEWQWHPAVTSLADGGFVIIWESTDFGYFGGHRGVHGQVFDGDGNPDPAGEFRVSPPNHWFMAGTNAVTGLADGGFVVTWDSTVDGEGVGIGGRIFDGDGNPDPAGEFQVNTYTTSDQRYSAVTSLADDSFVVTWHSHGQDGSDWGIYGQVFNGDGDKEGNEFQVNTYTNYDQDHPAVTSLENGGFVVTWHSESQDGSYNDIYGQVFDAYGDKEGNEFKVNYTTYSQHHPTVTGLAGGGFLIIWQSNGQDGSGYGIYGQVFDANGDPDAAGEFRINNYTYGNQDNPAVTSLEDGGFVVTWGSGGDGSATGIFSQMFTIGEEVAAWGSGTFYGTPLNDVIWGDDQDQTIYGRSGNDILKGGAGADTMYGESGDDTFVIWGTFAAGYYVDDPQTPDVDEGRDATGDYLAAGNPDSLLNHIQLGEIIDGGDGVDTLATYGDVDLTMADLQNMEILEIKENSTVTVNENQMTGLTVTGQGKLNPQTSLSLPDFMASYGANIGQSVTVGNAATAILILDSQQNSVLSIDENSTGLIGYLSAMDQDSGDSHTFTLTGGLSHGFRIENNNELWLDTGLDYESSDTVAIDIMTTDLGHAVYDSSLSFSVNDVDEQAFRTLGHEFQVNSYTSSWQDIPAITSLEDGGFVVTWSSSGQDGDYGGIYGQMFDADGNTDGNEFQVNNNTTNNQYISSVTGLTDGGFVVAWESYNHDGSYWGIYGQMYDADGNTEGNEFQVNTETTNSQESPSITGLADGGFVVTWDSRYQDGSHYGVYGQVFSAAGNPEGSEFQINTETNNSQESSSVTGLADGGFVVTWQSDVQDGSYEGVYGQVFDADGDKEGNEFLVNTETDDSQMSPAVTSLIDGGFVVTWESHGYDGDYWGIYGQMFTADGNPEGNEFQINTYTDDGQRMPAVTSLANGGFVVTWQSDYQDDSNYGIYGQVFDADGNPDPAGEFQVSTYTDNDQADSTVTGLPDGGFVVTWESFGQDGNMTGIYGQMYSTVQAIAASGAGTFYGNSGIDIIWGDNQDQILYGGSGNDILKGGIGADTMYGEDGDDTFVVWGTFNASDYVDEGRDPAGHSLLQGNTAADNHIQAGEIIDGGQDEDTLVTYGDVDLSAVNLNNMEILEIKNNSTVTVNENQLTGLTITGQGKLDPLTSLSLPAFMTSYGANIGQGVTVGNAATAILILDSQQNSILSIDENSTGLIGYLSAVDQDSGDAHTFTVTNGASQGFRIENNNELWLDSGLDYELSDTVIIDIQATDLGHGVYIDSHSFSVNDLYEPSFRQLGQEFQVNTYTLGNQSRPDVTGLENGDFVVTWQAYDGSSEGIYGQIFDADGSPDGNEFRVNTYTSSYQQYSAVTSLTNGGFVVTWESYKQDLSGEGIYGQVYDSNGDKDGIEFQVNTYTTLHQEHPSVTGLTDGGFVVTWESGDDQDGSEEGIFGQLYDSNGNRDGSEFQVNSYTNSYQDNSSATSLTDGGFVITWESGDNQDGNSNGIYGQIFDADGDKEGSEFNINTYTYSSQQNPAVTSLTDGGFVVTWESLHQDYSLYGIYGQVFDADGNPAGDEFKVNTCVSGYQVSSAVTGLTDGGFVVSWASDGQDGDGYGIYGKVFYANGIPDPVGEFQVNTYTIYHQVATAVTSLANGDFVISWQSADDQDGSGIGIYSQMYTVGKEITASGSGTFSGNIHNDIIWGDNQEQTIYGGTGNDILKGGGGADAMYGEDGDDTFVIWGSFAASYYLDDPATVHMNESIDPAGDNLLAGNADPADNHLEAGEIIDGGDGNDTLITYGTLDLSQATITNIETIITHSNVTYGVGQLEEASINTIIGEGEEAHILNFTGVGTVDLREVTVENIDEINIDSGVDLLLSQEQEAELNVNVVEETVDETTRDIPTARGTDPVATQPLFGDSIPETDDDTTEDAPLTGEEPEEATAPEAPPEQLFGDSPEENEEEKATETEEEEPLFGDNESDSGSNAPDGPETEEPLLADTGSDEPMDVPASDPPADLPEDVGTIDDVDIPAVDQADDLSAAA